MSSKEETCAMQAITAKELGTDDDNNKHVEDHEILAIKTGDRSTRNRFIFSVIIMLICGSSNDYLGKLAYQTLHDVGLIDIEYDYWTLWMLTTGSFFICSFAIFTKNSRKSYKLLTKRSFLKISIPAFMDLFVTGGRYLALIFLPAEVISILKNGFQLFFLALFRRFWRKKLLTKLQWIALIITMMGLLIVSIEDIFHAANKHLTNTVILHIIGICLLIFVGFLGAIRNTMEEILMQNDDKSKEFTSDFLVGMESILSLTFMIILGITLLFTHPFHQNSTIYDMMNVIRNIFEYTGFDICFLFFIIAIYGKDTMQMKVAKLSSALTRKLFQQLYPIGTWILSLVTHQIHSVYGVGWDSFSWIQLIGFLVVLLGTYLYIKPPKLTKEEKEAIKMKEIKMETDDEGIILKSDCDLYPIQTDTDIDGGEPFNP